MKLAKYLLLTPALLVSLSSCNKLKRYEIEEYFLQYSDCVHVSTITSSDEFNILQLSDIHLTSQTNYERHFAFIEKTVRAAQKAAGQIDLIVITGDLFTLADKGTVQEFCNFFETRVKVPWTCTFGNHDEQGYFSVEWLTGYLNQVSKKEGSYLLFKDNQYDDVFGSANFVINVNNDDYGRQIVILDSNRYNYGEGFGYDYIHTDQIDWYDRAYHYAMAKYYTQPTSLAFFHIPVPEFVDARKAAQSNPTLYLSSDVYDGDGNKVKTAKQRSNIGEEEDPSVPKVNSGFYDEIVNPSKADGYTKGIFVGHDHINNYAINYTRSGDTNSVSLVYGIKANDVVYYDNEALGGQIIKYHNDGTFDTDLVLHKQAGQ